MQLKPLFTLSLLAGAHATPLHNLRSTTSRSHLQSRDPPNLASDLDSYGLKKDSWERKLYDVCVKWEKDHIDDKKGLDKYWLFWATGDYGQLQEWADEYEDGKYHDGIDKDDKKEIITVTVVYGEPRDLPEVAKVLDDWADEDDDSIERASDLADVIVSWRGAQRAAEAGGVVRYLGMENDPDLPEKRLWTDVEAFELTKPGTKVERILRYNVGKEGFKEIWKKGDKPLGVPLNFADWKGKSLNEELKEDIKQDGLFDKLQEETKDKLD